jgi:mono/diheme cytochrome c family protein
MIYDRSMQRRMPILVIATACAALVGCRGGEQKAPPAESAAAPATSPGGMAAPGAAALEAPVPGTPPAGATAAMLAEGDSIFHGQLAGGLCYTCHGADAKGTALAPPLIQHQWRTGDGSYAFIQKRIIEGMPSPTPPYTAPMLPMGGAQLSPDQIKAVAAYEYSISHP